MLVVCSVYRQLRFFHDKLQAQAQYEIGFADSVAGDSAIISSSMSSTEWSEENGSMEGNHASRRIAAKASIDDDTTAINNSMAMDEILHAPAPALAANSSFDWDFLEPSISGVCGMNKCFFRSKNDPTKNGYLIAHHPKCDLDLGWEIATRLERKYNIHHLYLSPPQAVPVSSEVIAFASKIRKKAESTFFYKVRSKEFSNRANMNATADPSLNIDGSKDNNPTKKSNFVKIQEVGVAPTPSLEWGDNWKRQKKCAKDFYTFANSIDNKDAFANRLTEQIASLKALLGKEPWLLSDFQILIDKSGTLIHLDLDRKPTIKKIENADFRRRYVVASLKIILQKVVVGNRTTSLPNIPEKLAKQVC